MRTKSEATRCVVLVAGAMLLGGLPPAPAAALQIREAEAALRTGEYDDALSAFRRAARSNDSPEAARGLAQALGQLGRYREAEEAARRFIAGNPGSGELANTLGELLASQGRLEEAERAFRTAITAGASDSLTAELNLAILQYDRGEREAALQRFDRFIDYYNSRTRLTAQELLAVATAARYVGVESYQLYQDALRVLDDAAALDPGNLTIKLRIGELFLEKYEGPSARSTFDEILAVNPRHPGALLGLARTLHFDGSPEAIETVGRSLEVRPTFVPALAFLGRLDLELEDYDQAIRQAEKALAVNPKSLEALTLLAAADYLRGDRAGFDEAKGRVLSLNPRYAELFETLADVSARNRLYQEAVGFARQAIALDPQSWRGYGLLGMNQLRTGAIEEGRENLETAFDGDPYDVWVKNTLDLLDTFEEFRETPTARFQLVMHRDEAEVLAGYMGSLAEEAYDRLSARYGYRPPTPIRLEVYPRHADFSVRTVGLVGLGALGVSFGPVLAMDSPSARGIGEFNWGSTLWHEVAHSFHLGITHNRVPRWFTEGLAVFEERRARPGWGDGVSAGFLIAYKQNRLLPVSRLNDGFVRPTYPQQVIYSYYQASLVCELIETEWGFSAIAGMLRGFADGRTTEEVFESVLQIDLDAFEGRFIAYLERRFAKPLAALRSVAPTEGRGRASRAELLARADENPSDFAAQLAMGQLLFDEGDLDEAVPYLERARALFPEYAAPDSPYWYLARIRKAHGEFAGAARELETLIDLSATHYQAHLELADLRKGLGDDGGAAAALERALYIYPLEIELHTKMAELYERLGRTEETIRERRAVIALGPADSAEAWYHLARGYLEAGRLNEARRSILTALERAPTYQDALDLLLEIRRRRGGS